VVGRLRVECSPAPCLAITIRHRCHSNDFRVPAWTGTRQGRFVAAAAWLCGCSRLLRAQKAFAAGLTQAGPAHALCCRRHEARGTKQNDGRRLAAGLQDVSQAITSGQLSTVSENTRHNQARKSYCINAELYKPPMLTSRRTSARLMVGATYGHHQSGIPPYVTSIRNTCPENRSMPLTCLALMC